MQATVRIPALALSIALGAALAADKPASALTVEERQAAYDIAVNQISSLLKSSRPPQFTPVELTIFSAGRKHSIDVLIEVDAENSSGVMQHKSWWCQVPPQSSDADRTSCSETTAKVPKDFVVGIQSGPHAERPVVTSPPDAPKLEEILTAIHVVSSPPEAMVEVDGYPAGKTPGDVKLVKGEYTMKVIKPGFQTWTQKISVEPGKAQDLSVTLTPLTK